MTVNIGGPSTGNGGLRTVRGVIGAAALALLVACGGGKEEADAPASEERSSESVGAAPTGPEVPASRDAAARFLTQATFGPTEASIQRVLTLGYSRWIDEQWTRPVSGHRAFWEYLDANLKTTKPNATMAQDGYVHAFWRSALIGEDQLRQRVAFALSQIFVISMQEPAVGDNPRAVAAYHDMLATTGLTTYRQLLEAVATHPMMGRYLTMLGNRKADLRTGRVPDENFAREVMQLMSIGLWELNLDGTPRLVNGQPVETYGPADIAGLAKVFTGWSWACPVAPTLTNSTCFTSGSTGGQSDPDRTFKRMVAYPQWHSTEAKSFLGVTVPAQTEPNAAASLRVALDRLATHPNTAPFISKQLIQRLVTSNPSRSYVRDVATVFRDTGGDMKAVVKAILMHEEARQVSSTSGKVREPLLRVTALMRAFPFKSDSGHYKFGLTDNPGTHLGQTVMRSPSVFNFYRPGYVPPGSETAAKGLVAPEMQIAHESAAAGYVNYMRELISNGIGQTNPAPFNRRDMQPDFREQMALADRPADLVELVNARLMYGSMPAALKTLIRDAVAGIPLPKLGGNVTQTQVDTARRNRVNAALFLTVISPEFVVQK